MVNILFYCDITTLNQSWLFLCVYGNADSIRYVKIIHFFGKNNFTKCKINFTIIDKNVTKMSAKRKNHALTKNGNFRILLPVDMHSINNDISQLKTRNWLVPGEKSIVLIEVKNCLDPPDSFSFYCNVTRMSCPQKEHSTKCIQMKSLIPNYSLPVVETIKADDGTIYVPARITVPTDPASTLIIGAYCFGSNRETIASLTCFSFMPFRIMKSIDYTPQSMIVSFKIDVNFPSEWKYNVSIMSATLKFDEKKITETNLAQNIAIISTNDTKIDVFDGDTIKTVFALKPMSDVGGAEMSNLPMVLHLAWRALSNDYSSVFALDNYCRSSDLVITAPTVRVKLLENARIPITMTCVRGDLPKEVTVNFGANRIQPMTKSMKVVFTNEEKVKVINFGFIPLVSGQHELDISAESEGAVLKPLFPIFIDVTKE